MTTDPSPKLPLWVFVVSDVALLATAWLIAEYSPHPLSSAAVAGIAGCAALGSLALLVPLLLRYERQKNEVLDERQRALEGIARTVQESAEQLSIAANGLNQIAGLTRQSLQTAEALPEKLKVQLAAFDTKATSAHEAERAGLEKEIAALRKTNTDQLAKVATQIGQVTQEWTKLEAAAREHLAGANETLSKLDQHASTRIAAAHANALAELEARLKSLTERVAATVATPPPVTPANPAPTASAAEAMPPASATSSESATPDHVEPAVIAAQSDPAVPVTPPTPKRPRKPRREATPEPAISEPAATAEAPVADAPITTESTPTIPPAAAVEVAPEPEVEAKPTGVSSESVPEVIPAATSAAIPPEPVSSSASPTTPEASVPKEESAAPTETIPEAPAPTPAPNPAESPRKRSARAKPEPAPEPMLDLVIDDSAPPARTMERGLSSDGATRLIVTAYIGIGNRLFIRGEGPGLSPDKGVPLQFVSIGKWRWETNDATTPVRFRILKNDSVECTGLGEQTLEPGHQAEFGANF